MKIPLLYTKSGELIYLEEQPINYKLLVVGGNYE